jgi:exodeoxyribonuclease V gamma subunit
MDRDTNRLNVIHVAYSNQLELLADKLIENLSETQDGPATRLFALPPIIVPNLNIATYLKYEIARGIGIAAGLKFQMTEEFLGNLIRRNDSEPVSKLVNSRAMRAFFIDVLSEEEDRAQPLPDVVRTYLAAGGDDQDARDLRRFQLASRLASVARQYGNYRPNWLRDWAQGQATLGGSPLAANEEWQPNLWARLTEHVHAPPDRDVNWILPSEFFASLLKSGFEPPATVHLFGFSYVWHGLREMIEHLSEKTNFCIYTLSPLNEFAGDRPLNGLTVKSGRRVAKGRARATQVAEHGDVSVLDNLSIVEEWGRPGREYFAMLQTIAGIKFDHEFVPGERETVLGRLQREVLARAREPDARFERDDSLVILACPGIRREAEIVANEIWKLIRDSSSRHLRFRDFAVLLADQRNKVAYQAHFRAVFEELHGIPFNMIDLPLAGECRVIEGLLLLMALPLGEFTRPEMLKILTHPAVRARFPEADVNRWRDWCLGLEIVRGADRIDHDGTYIDRELFHWEQGLKRLVLGAFMSGPQSGDDRVYEVGGVEYLPYDQPADALADIGRLLALIRSLVADARFARSAQLTMTEWSAFFSRMVNAYLAADLDSEERALSQALQQIEKLRDLDVSGREVGYRIAYESLREALEGLTGSRGHYLADGVVVSPLLEMRSLPFRVVFLCGLGEGRFPAVDGPNPLDLTLADRQAGDVSPRERDKYLFLETLVCAREHLYLTYVARDAQTGDELAPSSVVHELISYLQRGHADAPRLAWIEKQPLRRFDESYFTGKTTRGSSAMVRPNFSTAARREWQARELRLSLRDHGNRTPRLAPDALRRLDRSVVDWLGLCPIEGSRAEPLHRLAITFRDLLGFLKCPLQGWARLMLRLRQDDDEVEAVREDEPFVTAPLGETTLLREVFFDALGGDVRAPATDDFERLYALHIASRVRRGLIPIGLFGEAERRRHLACLANWSASARQRDLVGRRDFQVYRFGCASEDERVDRIENPIILDVPVIGSPRPVRVELHGRTELVIGDVPASITPVVRDKPAEKDFLAGFLDAVVLSLLPGRRVADEYHAHVIPGGDGADLAKSHRVFHGIDQAKAQEFLINLLADLLGGSHDYLLPCEAVFDYVSKNRSIQSSVEEMKENDSKSCSSRFGPVPNFEEYEPLSDDEAKQVIERRFGLFLESGGKGT